MKLVRIKASDLSDRTFSNDGLVREDSVVEGGGKVLRVQSDSDKSEVRSSQDVASVNRPIPPGDDNTSIHSHPTKFLTNAEGNLGGYDARKPEPGDTHRNNRFSKNINVGNLGVPQPQADMLSVREPFKRFLNIELI